MDALVLSETFKEEIEQYAIQLEIYHKTKKGKKGRNVSPPEKPQANIRFLGRNIFEHILLHLRRVRSAELENTMRYLNQK